MTRTWVGMLMIALGSFGLGYWVHHPESVSVPVRVAQAKAAKADAIYRDSVRVLNHWQTKYVPGHDSATVAIQRIDSAITQPILDTAQLREDLFVVHLGLATADSTVKHCFGTVLACEASNAAKDTVIKALLADRPSRWSQFVKYAEVAGVSYAIGRLSPQWKVPTLHLSF